MSLYAVDGFDPLENLKKHSVDTSIRTQMEEAEKTFEATIGHKPTSIELAGILMASWMTEYVAHILDRASQIHYIAKYKQAPDEDWGDTVNEQDSVKVVINALEHIIAAHQGED